MRSSKPDKAIHLPLITNKQTISFYKDASNKSRIRPYSSSKLTDLQHNLFTQFEQYDSIDRKLPKNTKNKYEHHHPTSNKDVNINPQDIDAPYLKKLEKILPDTYLKLMELKKLQPTQERHSTNNKSIASENTPHKEPQKWEDPADQDNQNLAIPDAQQAEQIFQSFLEKEGLTAYSTLKPEKLRDLSHEISNTESQIQELKHGIEDIIRQFGDLCIQQDQQYLT